MELKNYTRRRHSVTSIWPTPVGDANAVLVCLETQKLEQKENRTWYGGAHVRPQSVTVNVPKSWSRRFSFEILCFNCYDYRPITFLSVELCTGILVSVLQVCMTYDVVWYGFNNWLINWLIDWLVFIRARNKRTCNKQNNSDNAIYWCWTNILCVNICKRC